MKKTLMIITLSILILLLNINIMYINDTTLYKDQINDTNGSYFEIQIYSNQNNVNNNWPMFKQNPQHTGLNNYAINDNPGRVQWELDIGEFSYNNGPVINNDSMIFIGSSDLSNVNYFSIRNNGSINWSYIRSQDGLEESICIDNNGNLYFTTNERKLISLDSNGNFRWEKDNHSKNSPIFHPDVGLITWDKYGNIISYSINGSINWKTFVNDWDYHRTPAIAPNGTIYSSNSQGKFLSIDMNGNIKWEIDLSTVSSPSIDIDGNIYVGSISGIFCIRPNGSIKWEYSTGYYVNNCPSININNEIVFGCDNGKIYSLWNNGTLHWDYLTGDTIKFSSPAIDGNGIIYIGSRDSYFYALNPNGSLKWKIKLSDDILDSPAIDDFGNVYISSNNGILYSIGALRPSSPLNPDIFSGNEFTSLNWTTPIDDGGAEITQYNIYKNSTEGYKEYILSLSPNEYTFNDTNVINGVQYTYWITAKNREGESRFAGPFNATPRGPPSTPLNVSVSVGPGSLNISWNEPLTDGGYPIDGYRIYRKEVGIFMLLDETSDLFYIDTVANPGVDYVYYIVAVNEYGEGPPTETFHGMSIGVPPAPEEIFIERYDGALRLNWSLDFEYLDPFEIIKINVYRNGTLFHEGFEDLSFYNDTGLINGIEYTYQISFENIVGEGSLSENITSSPAWIPTPPSNLEAFPTKTEVLLTWSEPEDDRGESVTGYSIYKSLDGIDFTLLEELTSITYKDTLIEIGKTYYYAISCSNAMGSSEWTEIIDVTIPIQDPPESPVLKDLILNDNNKIELEWTHSATGVTFTIFRSSAEDSGYFELGNTTGTTYVDSNNIMMNQTYYYYIVASDEIGRSQPSNINSIFVPLPGDDDPDPVNDGGWYIYLIIGVLLFVVVIVVLFFVMRNKSDDDEGESNPSDSEVMNEETDAEDLETMIQNVSVEGLITPTMDDGIPNEE